MWRFAAVACAATACGRLDFETVAAVGPTDAATDATDATNVVLPAPVGWWKLDETTGTMAADSSAHGLVGSLVGSPSWAPGHTGNGIALNGSSQYVQVLDDAALRISGSWTLSLWVKLTTAPANAQMYTLAAKTDASGNENYSLRIDNNYGQFGPTGPGSFVAQFAGANAVDTFTSWKPAGIDTGVWISVAATWEASTSSLTLYVNGALQAGLSNPIATPPTSGSGQPFLIGDNAGHLGQATPGILDDVRIYGVALSAEQIAALYAGG